MGDDDAMRRVVTIVTMGLLATGCGGGGGGAESQSPPAEPVTSSAATTSDPVETTTASSSTSTSTTTAPCTDTGRPVTARTGPEPSSTMLLRDVVVDSPDGCVDVVRFTFLPTPDERPGYTVEYQPGPFAQSGSGAPVPVEGEAFLVVRFFPAAIADLAQDMAPLTYTGPDTLDPTTTRHVQQLRLVDTFEGYVTWVIGLDARVGFDVTTSAGPPNLVVAIG